MPVRPVYRCQSCVDRKVKCDKLKPTCSSCSRLELKCVYGDPSVSMKRKRAKFDDLAPRTEYESLLKRHSPQQTPPHTRGSLVNKPDSRRYVDSVLWNAIGGSDEYEDTHDLGSPSPLSLVLLGSTSSPVDLSPYRPSDTHINFIWSVFVDRVDPLVKVLHRPTARAAIQANESLLFAVCLLSIISMSAAECVQTFGATKNSLVTRYHEATQIALLNADYLRSNSIPVFQAYTLFLVVNRSRFDTMVVWILVGNGLRIAQRLGLHRDGSLVGLPPFETEINRRVFWQYPPLEVFASQVAGVTSSLDSAKWDTKPVMNINDTDIWPDMTESPKERNEASDLMFQLSKSAVVHFHNYLGPVLAALGRDLDNIEMIQEAERRILELEDSLEVKYLRYCDPMEPLHMVTSIMARVSIKCQLFRIRLPRAKAGLVTGVEAEKMYDLARKIVDRLGAAHLSPALDKYRWHTEVYVIWDIVIWLVNYVRRDADKKAAWQGLEAFCKNHPDIIAPRQSFTFAIIKLIVKAWDTQMSDAATPGFILHMKQILNDKDAQALTAQQRAMFDMHFDDGYDWTFWDRMMKNPSAFGYVDD